MRDSTILEDSNEPSNKGYVYLQSGYIGLDQQSLGGHRQYAQSLYPRCVRKDVKNYLLLSVLTDYVGTIKESLVVIER